MKKNLKKATRQYYARQVLNDQQLDDLQRIYSKNKMLPKYMKKRYWGVAASLLVAALAVLLLIKIPLISPPAANNEPLISIVAEVAKEHFEQDPLEVTSLDFSALQSYFTNLAFSPYQSTILTPQLDLQGGRYCSIQGVKAIQIRYHAENNSVTLYEVPYNINQHGVIPVAEDGKSPLIKYYKGLEIQLWVEKELLMVAAKNRESH